MFYPPHPNNAYTGVVSSPSSVVWSTAQPSSFHTTSAYRNHSANRSFAGESAASAGRWSGVSSSSSPSAGGGAFVSPVSVGDRAGASSVSFSMYSVSPKVMSSAADRCFSQGNAAAESSFYSTSVYRLQSVSGVSGNAAVNPFAGANAAAMQSAYAIMAAQEEMAYMAQADLAYMSQATPRDMSMAQVNRFYATADDVYEQYLAADGGQSKMYASRRPNDGPSIGELAPVGDAVLPLLACVAAYAVYKIRRVISLKKVRVL